MRQTLFDELPIPASADLPPSPELQSNEDSPQRCQHRSGVSSLGVPGVPWHSHILVDQFALSQPGGADYAPTLLLAPLGFQIFLWPCR